MEPGKANMAVKPAATPGSGRALVPSDRARAAIVGRLRAKSGTIATSIVGAIGEAHPWYSDLDADSRSWISMIVSAAVDNFATWFDDDTNEDVTPASIFAVAPRSMTRQLTLGQTVDLVRTSITAIEREIDELMPKPDRVPLQTSLLYYSRQAAFAAAEVYAWAAESRGSWDEHVESRIVDALMRDRIDDDMLSRASTLGWPAAMPVVVMVGCRAPTKEPPVAVETLHQCAESIGRQALGAVQGEHLVAVVSAENEDDPIKLAKQLQPCFGPGPIVVGPVVAGLAEAHNSAAEAASGALVVNAWPEHPAIVTADALLPERALTGNPSAKQALVDVYQQLVDAGSDLLETCAGFLDHSGSIEATARDMFIHPNTVRYRLKRIQDVTDYSPANARDAFLLRLALTLGRLAA